MGIVRERLTGLQAINGDIVTLGLISLGNHSRNTAAYEQNQ
jgi:hypothetical protein